MIANSRVLIITGMHRSGTSLVSQWLYRCGLFIGKKLVPADIGNSDGHFEDADFLEIHEQFLKTRGLPASGFTHKAVPALTIEEKNQLQSLIVDKCREQNEWGWKEPRTCLFLSNYKELLPSAFYLVVVRGYNDTVSSMLSREYAAHTKRFRSKKGLTRLKWVLFKKRSRESVFKKYAVRYLKIWIHYYEHILEHILSLPREQYMIVPYTRLLDDDKKVFDHLKETWQFPLGYFPFNQVFKKSLLSDVKNIALYVKDKDLIKRAEKIDQVIGKLCEA